MHELAVVFYLPGAKYKAQIAMLWRGHEESSGPLVSDLGNTTRVTLINETHVLALE